MSSYLHAKVAVVDETWATVGSSNIDPYSLLLAREANLVVFDAGFALRLAAATRSRCDSRPVHAADFAGAADRARARLDRVRLVGFATVALARGAQLLSGARLDVERLPTTSRTSCPSSCRVMTGTRSSSAARGPVLPGRRLLHRSLAAGRARGDHACPRRSRPPGPCGLPRRGRRAKCCARALARSRCRRWPTARRSTSTASASRCIRPGTCWVRHRCASSIAAHLGRRRRLQAGPERDLRRVRAAALRHVHHRVDLRPADLPLGRGDEVFAEIDAWWAANAAARRASVLFCYAFGKAQRILAGVDCSIGPIVVHGAVEPLNAPIVRAAWRFRHPARRRDAKDDLRARSVLAPPSAQGSPWLRRFGDYSDAFASRLDAAARRAPAPCARPRLRAVRSCRLARPAVGHRCDRRRRR